MFCWGIYLIRLCKHQPNFQHNTIAAPRMQRPSDPNTRPSGTLAWQRAEPV